MPEDWSGAAIYLLLDVVLLPVLVLALVIGMLIGTLWGVYDWLTGND